MVIDGKTASTVDVFHGLLYRIDVWSGHEIPWVWRLIGAILFLCMLSNIFRFRRYMCFEVLYAIRVVHVFTFRAGHDNMDHVVISFQIIISLHDICSAYSPSTQSRYHLCSFSPFSTPSTTNTPSFVRLPSTLYINVSTTPNSPFLTPSTVPKNKLSASPPSSHLAWCS